MSRPLFSVVLVHYSQPHYVKEALDSIFVQDYNNIEFIFADDCSQDIDLKDLKDYVEQNKGENIKNVVWQINEENLGTVKSLNRAVEKCNGKYILVFAADDKLFNKQVLSNFVKNFETCSDDIYMISAQCLYMDISMEQTLGLAVQPNFARDFNSYDSVKQFKTLSKCCFLPIGATCMRAEMFKKFGYFNEKYKLVEDWSYFLHLTRNGGKIKFYNFEALYHRDGGTSHYEDEINVPSNVLNYKFDIVQIFENEVLPYMKIFSTCEKSFIMDRYECEKASYYKAGGDKPCFYYYNLFKLVPVFSVKRKLWRALSLAPEKMNNYFNIMSKISAIWISFILFDLLLLKFSSNFQVIKILHNCLLKLNFFVFPVLEIIFLLAFALYFLVFFFYKIKKFLKK